MDKKRILAEIRRTTEQNDGDPLGIDRFREETGIRKEDWYGIYWARWSDAQAEAGVEPNRFGEDPIEKDELLRQVALLTRELGRYPTKPECKLRKRRNPSFPNVSTLRRRLGAKAEQVSRLKDYCERHDEWQDVASLLEHSLPDVPPETEALPGEDAGLLAGQVYMLKHNKAYKIGRSTDAARRYRDIKVQMPYATEEVHVIETDDTVGIEAYWHKRFASMRLEGEWFQLSASDVRAFKKRRFQ